MRSSPSILFLMLFAISIPVSLLLSLAPFDAQESSRSPKSSASFLLSMTQTTKQPVHCTVHSLSFSYSFHPTHDHTLTTAALLRLMTILIRLSLLRISSAEIAIKSVKDQKWKITLTCREGERSKAMNSFVPMIVHHMYMYVMGVQDM